MSLKTKTVRNLQFVGIAQILSLGLTELGYLILARILTPADFGLYAAVMVVFNLCVTVSMVGLNQAAIQSKDESEELFRTAATFRMTMAIIAIVVVLILAPVIASFFGRTDMTNPLRVMTAAIFILSAGFVSTVRLTKTLRFRELSIINIGNAIAWPAVAITAGVIGLTYWSMILATLFASAVTLAMLWTYAPWKISYHIDKAIMKKLLHFGKFPAATGVVVFLSLNLDKIAVGRLLGADLLGIYFMAYTWGTLVPTIFTGIVNSVMFPTYSTISHDRDLISKGYLKTLTYLGYISLPMGFGLAAISPIFVSVLLGSKWTAGAGTLAILSLVGTCSALTSPAGSLFMAMGKPEISWRITAILFVPYLILLAPAAIYFGIVGVSILMLAMAATSLVWVLIVSSRLIGIGSGTILRGLLRPIVSAVIMGICVFAASILLAPSILSLAGLIGLGILIYTVAAHYVSNGTIIKELAGIIIRP